MADNEVSGQDNTPSLNSFEAGLDPKQAMAGTKVDGLLWLVAVVLLIGATLVTRYLPQYALAGQNPVVQGAVIASMLVLAIGLMYLTKQGKAFVRLVKDAFKERAKITWATMPDTKRTTWLVLLVVIVIAIILGIYDWVFNTFIKLFT